MLNVIITCHQVLNIRIRLWRRVLPLTRAGGQVTSPLSAQARSVSSVRIQNTGSTVTNGRAEWEDVANGSRVTPDSRDSD